MMLPDSDNISDYGSTISSTSSSKMLLRRRSYENDIAIEARLRDDASMHCNEVKTIIHQHLSSLDFVLINEPIRFDNHHLLPQLIDKLSLVCPHNVDDSFAQQHIPCSTDGALSYPIVVYRCQSRHEQMHIESDEDASSSVGSQIWHLPNRHFDDLWDNLIYDNSLKGDLLNFVKAIVRFSEAGVDPSIITVNRLLLFHGPPGTGKTTLCKALAQRLTIRLHERYKRSYLVEVNSHSLFSKWFSESGKLVTQLFQQISSLCEDEQALVCVLVDEVESVTMARQMSLGNNEPSDSVRVVNALLTQIDNIRRHKNAILLTTSNLSEAVDAAFIDRADIKCYIPPPQTSCIYSIYAQAIRELQRVSILNGELLPLVYKEKNLQFVSRKSREIINRLYMIAKESKNLSGRTLRKLPAIAFARSGFINRCTLEEYLDSLHQCVLDEKRDRNIIEAGQHLNSKRDMTSPTIKRKRLSFDDKENMPTR